MELTLARLTTLPAPPHPRASVPIFFSWDESPTASWAATSPGGDDVGIPVFLHPTGSWTALVLYWWLWPYQWTFFCRSWLSPSEKYSLIFQHVNLDWLHWGRCDAKNAFMVADVIFPIVLTLGLEAKWLLFSANFLEVWATFWADVF
jgi:hypothetical protein